MPTLACVGEASGLAWEAAGVSTGGQSLHSYLQHSFELSWRMLEVNNPNGKSSNLSIHDVQGEEAEKERCSCAEAQSGSYKGPKCGHSPK